MNVSKLNEKRPEGTPGSLLSSLFRSRHTIPDLVILMLEFSHEVGDTFGPVGHSGDFVSGSTLIETAHPGQAP